MDKKFALKRVNFFEFVMQNNIYSFEPKSFPIQHKKIIKIVKIKIQKVYEPSRYIDLTSY